MSEVALRALRIIRDHDVQAPAQFARLLWPDARGWEVVVRCGHGSHQGGAMPPAAGAYLARLVRRGLLWEVPRGRYRREWRLTETGKRALEAADRR